MQGAVKRFLYWGAVVCGTVWKQHRGTPHYNSDCVLELLICRSGLYLHPLPSSLLLPVQDMHYLHSCIPGAASDCSLFACTKRFGCSPEYCVNSGFWLFLQVHCICQLESAWLYRWERNLLKKVLTKKISHIKKEWMQINGTK